MKIKPSLNYASTPWKSCAASPENVGSVLIAVKLPPTNTNEQS